MSPEEGGDAVGRFEHEHWRDTHVEIDLEAEFALELGVWDPSCDGLDELDAIDVHDEAESELVASDERHGAGGLGGSP